MPPPWRTKLRPRHATAPRRQTPQCPQDAHAFWRHGALAALPRRRARFLGAGAGVMDPWDVLRRAFHVMGGGNGALSTAALAVAAGERISAEGCVLFAGVAAPAAPPPRDPASGWACSLPGMRLSGAAAATRCGARRAGARRSGRWRPRTRESH